MAGDATTAKDYATDAEVQSVLAFAELYRQGREGVAEAYLSTLLRLAPKLAAEVADRRTRTDHLLAALHEKEGQVQRLADQLAAARAALGLPDGADVAERVARLQEQVRLRESELLRCRTAENHAAATLDTIRAELRLQVGCPGVDVLNGVIALKSALAKIATMPATVMYEEIDKPCTEYWLHRIVARKALGMPPPAGAGEQRREGGR